MLTDEFCDPSQVLHIFPEQRHIKNASGIDAFENLIDVVPNPTQFTQQKRDISMWRFLDLHITNSLTDECFTVKATLAHLF